jgi:hypothetical protein
MDCCAKNITTKKCIRLKDGKTFSMRRLFSRKQCMGKIKGFTMKASCAPYKFCSKKGGTKKKQRFLYNPIKTHLTQYL